jgi:hypothetical protein
VSIYALTFKCIPQEELSMARVRRTPSSPHEGGDLALNMTFRVSSKVRDQLLAAAKANGDRSIGEEIRQRLEASFADRPSATVDPQVQEFALALAGMVLLLNHSFGDKPAFVHAALRKAIDMHLQMHSPPGDVPETVPNPGGRYGPLYKDLVTIDDAATVAAAAGETVVEDRRKP